LFGDCLESGGQHTLRKLVLALNFTFIAGFGVSVASSAVADCNGYWSVNGNWFLQQTNGWTSEFNLRHNGNEIQGDGWATGTEGSRLRTMGIEGTVDGTDLTLVVHWFGDAVGEYVGTISPQGWIVGETYDKLHPESRARWAGNRQAQCIEPRPPTTLGGDGKSMQLKLPAPKPPAIPVNRDKSMLIDP
jgi:hypothetical protein